MEKELKTLNIILAKRFEKFKRYSVAYGKVIKTKGMVKKIFN